MKIDPRRAASWALAAAVAMTCACAKAVKKPAGGAQAAAQRAPEPSIRGSEFKSAPELKTIHFEFDRHHLAEEARETLKRNAEVIKKNQAWQVLVEGHCDDRGTTEYNLALGQKRAKAVRDYYLLLTVPADRLATISYGEEQPLCHEPSEGCWAQDRRAEHKVKF